MNECGWTILWGIVWGVSSSILLSSISIVGARIGGARIGQNEESRQSEEGKPFGRFGWQRMVFAGSANDGKLLLPLGHMWMGNVAVIIVRGNKLKGRRFYR
jgi:hypothetical protein